MSALDSELWAIVLAAGEGRRVSALLRDDDGAPIPKQFFAFGDSGCMLDWALARARRHARERVLAVVAREHARHWESHRSLEGVRVVVQPENRGTAPGILLALLHVLEQDEDAIVVVLPSDHHVRDEAVFAGAIERAVAVAREAVRDVVLLGVPPEGGAIDYGWILKAASRDAISERVERFVEKPGAPLAAELLSQGALWNSFVTVATAAALANIFARALPELHRSFETAMARAPREPALRHLYASIPSRDASRDVLERSKDRLRLVAIPPCGWTDLGSPHRLERFLESLSTEEHDLAPAGSEPLCLP